MKKVSKHIKDIATPEEHEVMQKYTRCLYNHVVLKVGNQSFEINPQYDTAEEADWMRWMLAKALINFKNPRLEKLELLYEKALLNFKRAENQTTRLEKLELLYERTFKICSGQDWFDTFIEEHGL